MGAFNVRGGPAEQADDDVTALLVSAGDLVGARSFSRDPTANAYAFVIDAPTTPDAFTLVAAVFRPVFGDDWWAEIVAAPQFN